MLYVIFGGGGGVFFEWDFGPYDHNITFDFKGELLLLMVPLFAYAGPVCVMRPVDCDQKDNRGFAIQRAQIVTLTGLVDVEWCTDYVSMAEDAGRADGEYDGANMNDFMFVPHTDNCREGNGCNCHEWKQWGGEYLEAYSRGYVAGKVDAGMDWLGFLN